MKNARELTTNPQRREAFFRRFGGGNNHYKKKRPTQQQHQDRENNTERQHPVKACPSTFRQLIGGTAKYTHGGLLHASSARHCHWITRLKEAASRKQEARAERNRPPPEQRTKKKKKNPAYTESSRKGFFFGFTFLCQINPFASLQIKGRVVVVDDFLNI